MARRYAGIGLAKRTMKVCMLKGKAIGRHGLKTDGKGQQMLIQLRGPAGEGDRKGSGVPGSTVKRG
jgi:hypothetical protein